MRIQQISIPLGLAFGWLATGTSAEEANACSDKVSFGDKSVGIWAVEDARCASGGLGCFTDNQECRFCRLNDTEQSSHLHVCSDVQNPEFNIWSTVAPASTTQTKESGVDCAGLVSTGDEDVGISAVAATSPSCSENGLGCFQSSQCRYCQKWTTAQSGPYLKCSALGSDVSTTSSSSSCGSVVARSGLTGVSYVTESGCNVANPTLLGCEPLTSCQLCRNDKNEANQYLTSCTVLRDQAQESTTVDTATEQLVTLPTTSTQGAADSIPIDDNISPSQDASVQSVPQLGSGSSVLGVVGVVAAIAAVMAVVGVAVAKYRNRDPMLDECMTPDDGSMNDCAVTPTGNGSTPREGSLVQVVSQSQIATL